MKIKCIVCDEIFGETPPGMVKTNAPLVMLGFCSEHQPEPEPERDMEAERRESDRKLREACKRGEVKDADGNTLTYFVVTT